MMKRTLPNGSYVGFMGIHKRAGSTAPSFHQSGRVDTRIVLLKKRCDLHVMQLRRVLPTSVAIRPILLLD